MTALLVPLDSADADDIWVRPTHLAPPAINLLWPTTGSGFASFGFAVPADLQSFSSASVVVLPLSTVAAEFDAYAEMKRDGETVDVNDIAFSLNNPVNLSANEIQEIDITPLLSGLLDSTSPGNDLVSVFFWFPTGESAADAGRVLGLRFAYDSMTNGLSCWDLNGNSACDLGTEDWDDDGFCTVLDCQGLPGPPGPRGGDGSDGVDGIHCWDLNENGRCDRSAEDENGDNQCTVLDCKGPPGPAVTTIAACQIQWGIGGSRTCSSICPGASVVISQAFGPCTVTADTGSCSAIVPPPPDTPGTCCVCKP